MKKYSEWKENEKNNEKKQIKLYNEIQTKREEEEDILLLEEGTPRTFFVCSAMFRD